MIYVIIGLVLVVVVLAFAVYRQKQNTETLKAEHQALLDHYQRRVN